MADPFTAEIRIFGFNYAPLDWAFCDGATLSVQQFTPLYAIIGATYGSPAQNQFKLPNLQGLAALGTSPDYALASKDGAAGVALTGAQCPQHDHVAYATSAAGTVKAPQGNTPAVNTGTIIPYLKYDGVTPAPAMVTLSPSAMLPAGQASPSAHENRQPFQAMNFCICLNGTWPFND